jgi:hypothetical protein
LSYREASVTRLRKPRASIWGAGMAHAPSWSAMTVSNGTRDAHARATTLMEATASGAAEIATEVRLSRAIQTELVARQAARQAALT